MITELHYSSTNTYVIHGTQGNLLWDTGWAGTFPLLCRALGEQHLKLQDIAYLLISHYHPDHMGIAQEIAEAGVVIAAVEEQRGFLHASDAVFAKEKRTRFHPIRDEAVRFLRLTESRSFLQELGISGALLHTPGHSEDSISLWLDEERTLFVGDLNPLYELELHRGTQIAQSRERLLALKPRRIYYGHARTTFLG